MKLDRRLVLKLGVVALIGVLVLVAGYTALSWNMPINRLKRALTDKRSYQSETDWFGDYSQYIVGDLRPGRSFEELAGILELKERTEGRLPESMLGWSLEPDEAPWWQPPAVFDEIYYRGEKGGYQELLGRVGDRVYYAWDSW